MKRIAIIPCLTLVLTIGAPAFSQTTEQSTQRSYPFIIQDYPHNLMSMRQMNQNYLSANRLLTRGLHSIIKKPLVVDIISMTATALFFMPLTHEEGHRSILTHWGIGSVSQPFFNSRGAAYVNGVRDSELQLLRDTHLPDYIRLHTAGAESDYAIARRVAEFYATGADNYQNLWMEFLVREAALMQYYLMGLFKYEFDLQEEADELQRDIVGHDIYGAIRHMHRPSMSFHRYTRFSDLTGEEQIYAKQVGYRSLINFAGMALFMVRFRLADSLTVKANVGYTMAPFGDFVEENIWLNHRSTSTTLYFRQFRNRSSYFFGAGAGLLNQQIANNFEISLNAHVWQQPTDLNFNATTSFWGGAADATMKYRYQPKEQPMGISIDLGLMYKTKGFLPEEVSLQKGWGLRLGTTLYL